ncbi:MAG TPA: YncE family protein [Levilinea sp.]|nr:YncE family protein [Levilinea sp.]
MLTLSGSIELPEHNQPGGFDHAAVHLHNRRLYVAHTVNDTLDVIDIDSDRYTHSIPNLTGVAGALVSEERNLVFTSNRGEDTISIFSPEDETGATKVKVGIRPNGLAFDPQRGLLLAANVGNPDIPGSFTLSIVDVVQHKMVASIPVPGRTRWTVFDPQAEVFYVNIANPSQIVVVNSDQLTGIARSYEIPVTGPHGLDLDLANKRLFCACDGGQLVTVEAATGVVLNQLPLSGVPDVVFFNAALRHLYVAVGDPGVLDVFDTATMQQIESVHTEKGAHTIGFDPMRNKVYAFCPQTPRALVYRDSL